MHAGGPLRGIRSYGVVVCVAVAAAWPASAFAQSRPYIFGCGVVWGRWLGLNTANAKEWDRRSMDKIVQMGGTSCGANFAWIDIETVRGTYDWDYVDHQVDEARARGLESFAYCGLTPDWALPPGILEQYGSGIGYRFPPDEQYIPDFENFFRTLAARYRGRVKYYEFWNEPNGCSWINDGCANGHMAYTYVPWLIRWYNAMKQGDPDCVLAIGGLDYGDYVPQGYQYIEDIYANGGGDYFDAVAIHPYGSPLHWQAITDTYQVLLNHGQGYKKLWLNEYGWNTSDEVQKAADLTFVLSQLKQPQYDMVFHANYLVLTDLPGTPNNGHDYGLCSRIVSTLTIIPRQSWYAFRDFDKTFADYVDFTADPTSGVAPLTVQFTDQSQVAGANAWLWEFGDTQTSDLQNPSHTYVNPGTYSVRLRVTGTGGTLNVQKNGFITALGPYADFTATPTAGNAPLDVQFTDQSHVAGASTWFWEFGDGGTSSQQNPAHTYTQEGAFDVRLTVTGDGGPQTAQRTGYVRVGGFPRVAFIGGELPPTPADSQVIAHLESLGLLVNAYDDEPANRPTAAQIAATHDLVMSSSTTLSENVAGEFRHESVPFIFWEASLAWTSREAIAEGGAAIGGQSQLEILDNTHPIMAGIPTGIVTLTTTGADFSYCTGAIASGVRVLAQGVGDPARRTILVAEPGAALLDGDVAAGKRVMLNLYDTTWSSTNSTGVKIFDNSVAYALGAAAAGFRAAPVSGAAPLTVQFTDESTGPVTSWAWDFGDGGTSKLRNPSHTYEQPGAYAVSLTVGSPGQPSTLVRTSYVKAWRTTDLDGDSDVDLTDFSLFQLCFNGPNQASSASCLVNADLDGDGDTDLTDFGRFQACFNGPNRPPACQ